MVLLQSEDIAEFRKMIFPGLLFRLDFSTLSELMYVYRVRDEIVFCNTVAWSWVPGYANFTQQRDPQHDYTIGWFFSSIQNSLIRMYCVDWEGLPLFAGYKGMFSEEYERLMCHPELVCILPNKDGSIKP